MTIASCVDGGDGNLLSIEDDTTIHGLAVKKPAMILNHSLLLDDIKLSSAQTDGLVKLADVAQSISKYVLSNGGLLFLCSSGIV